MWPIKLSALELLCSGTCFSLLPRLSPRYIHILAGGMRCWLAVVNQCSHPGWLVALVLSPCGHFGFPLLMSYCLCPHVVAFFWFPRKTTTCSFAFQLPKCTQPPCYFSSLSALTNLYFKKSLHCGFREIFGRKQNISVQLPCFSCFVTCYIFLFQVI